MIKMIIPSLFVIALMGCSLAPKYERPLMPIPEHFKETGKWVKVKSNPQKVTFEPWWQAFNDPVLNDLEEKVTHANQDLKLAFAHYQSAYALAQVARSNLFPTAPSLFNASRVENSKTVANPTTNTLFNQLLLGVNLNYEIDAWGRVRNTVIANARQASASAADLATTRLSLHAELASDYFSLRGSDEQQRILDNTVSSYQKALYLTKKRYQGGASPVADVYEAETQLENAKTMAADVRIRRAQFENAIAVLVGEIPSNFSLVSAKMPKRVLAIAPNLPSTLLERRPDVASAELRVEAANANIGVARAAFFPQLNLTGTIGYQSQSLANLISKPSLFWSIGPPNLLTITQPIAQLTLFDGGKLRGLLNRAKADYYATVATYRKTVLTAFQEVEDNLVAIRLLDKAIRTQDAAARSARLAWQQEQYRYTGGIVTFLQVAIVENTALQAELAAVNVHTRRQIASIQLVKALGGGWFLSEDKDE